MDRGVLQILDDDEEEKKPAVSGEAFNASLDGDVRGAAAGGSVTSVDHVPLSNAMQLAHGLQSMSSPQASITSSLQTQATSSTTSDQGTGIAMQGASGEIKGSAIQQPASQWQQITPQQQEILSERRQQQQQQSTQQQGDTGQNSSSMRRSGGSSQAISFGTLMPMLLPTLQSEQGEKLLALYQKLRRSEISKEDFLRTTRMLVGDQVLVHTVKQMQFKQQQQSQVHGQRQTSQAEQQQQQQQHHPFLQQTLQQQQQSKQASSPLQPQQQSFQVQDSRDPATVKSNQQEFGQAHPQQQVQSNMDSTVQYQTSPLPPRVAHLSPLQMLHTNYRQEQWQERQAQPASGSLNLQQVKSEVDKTMASMHLARQQPQLVQHHLSQAGFPSSQALSSSGSYPMQTLVAASPGQGNSQSSGVSQQQISPQSLGQVQISQHGGQAQLFDAASTQSALKSMSKYAKQKLRKEFKKREDDEKLRVLGGGVMPIASQQAVHFQVAEQTQTQSVQGTSSQNHVSIKQEPLEVKSDQAPESQIQLPLARQESHSSDPSQQLENAFQPSDVIIISSSSSKEYSAQNTDALQNKIEIPVAEAAALSKSSVHAPVQHVGNSLSGHVGFVAANKNSQTNASPVISANVNTGSAPVSIPGNMSQLPAISVAAQGRTPPKKSPSDQRKAEVSPSMQARSKKPKVAGDVLDQSIDQLNDVTAVSGVNLREEEEQLLAGPKEESRTTQAMRRFAQEEEGRLFLEKGPLRTKVTAIAAKHGVGIVSEEVDQCLSISTEERLRNMLYKLLKLSNQRCDEEKARHKVVVASDVQRRIALMKKKAKEALEKKLAVESERVKKLNEEKGKGSQNEGARDDARTKEKKAQKDEEGKQRANAANVAARAAAGVNDMLIKWQMMAEQGRQKREGDSGTPDTGMDLNAGTNIGHIGAREMDKKHVRGGTKAVGRATVGGATSGAVFRKAAGGQTTSRGPVQRSSLFVQPAKSLRTITVRDVIAYLETDPQMAKSTLLYRLYDKSLPSSQAINASGSNLTSLST